MAQRIWSPQTLEPFRQPPWAANVSNTGLAGRRESAGAKGGAFGRQFWSVCGRFGACFFANGEGVPAYQFAAAKAYGGEFPRNFFLARCAVPVKLAANICPIGVDAYV